MGRRIKPFNIELDIIDAATDGRSVARHGEQVVFVEGGVPGDRADVRVFTRKKNMLIGKVEQIISPSPHRKEPVCQHFEFCGGCKWQHMSYEGQLKAKENQVYEVIRRISKIPCDELLPILGSDSDYFYRNKLEFTFSSKAWWPKEVLDHGEELDSRVLGFHVPRIFDKILDIDTCHLQLPIVNDIRNETQDFCRNQNIDFYDIRENKGFLRNLVFRTSVATGELMIILIVAQNEPGIIDTIFNHLAEKFPQITQFVWIHNPKLNSSYGDLDYQVWRGEPYIIEKLGDYRFKIRPTSFFQTNPLQAEKLYGVVKAFLKETLAADQPSHDIIYDLYSGTGSIGIFVSKLAEKIVGIEYVQAAVDDARENVQLNQLDDKFSFYAGDMKDLLNDELIAKEGRPNVVIADPPRQGMVPKVVDKIIEMAPEYVIYVSCNPSTQARDIAQMAPHYDLLKIQPVDMFPQTAHVENIALLRHK